MTIYRPKLPHQSSISGACELIYVFSSVLIVFTVPARPSLRNRSTIRSANHNVSSLFLSWCIACRISMKRNTKGLASNLCPLDSTFKSASSSCYRVLLFTPSLHFHDITTISLNLLSSRPLSLSMLSVIISCIHKAVCSPV